MNDFEKMIRDMVANGASAEDIAKTTGDTLNAIQKEQNSKKTQRVKILEDIENTFHIHYKNEKLNLEDVGALATLVVTPNYPDWSAKDIKEYRDGVIEMLKMRAEMVGKSFFDGMFSAIDAAVGMIEEKEQEEKKDKSKGGTDRTCNHKDTRSDAQKVRDFLDKFDW